MDLIGPWIVQLRGNSYEFSALTAIDTVTNLVELARIDDKTSDNVTRKYAQCWLAQYPWPQRCVHDPGGEFTGIEFQTLLENCHITLATRGLEEHFSSCAVVSVFFLWQR